MSKKSRTVQNQENATETTEGQTIVTKAIKNKLFGNMAIGTAAKIAGLIRNVEMDEGNYGTFRRFEGDFRCRFTDPKIGVVTVMAQRLFVPSVAETILAPAYEAAVEAFYTAHEDIRPDDNDDEETESKKSKQFAKQFQGVEFALALEKTADDDKRNARGFQWAVKPITNIAPPSDRLLALIAD